MFPLNLLRRSQPLVPVIRLSGVIGNLPYRGGLNLASLAGVIEQTFRARGAVAVALQINSPGGSPVQSALIHQRIRQLAAERKLPVVAFAEDVAASGGYWLALAADEIYADTNSIIGSIGVISAGFGFPRLLERFGIERRVHAQGARKAILDPFRPEEPEHVERLLSLQRDMHDSFKALVRERRGAKLKGDDATLFEGDVWTGRRALELGLIDGLGELRGVMRARYGDKVRLRRVGERTSWIRRRLGFRANLLADTLAALDERALWARYGL